MKKMRDETLIIKNWIQGVSKHMHHLVGLISQQSSIKFSNCFFPENWDPYTNFKYKTISVRYSVAKIFTKQNDVLKQINLYSYCLIVFKNAKFVPSSDIWPETGPDSSQVAPSGVRHQRWLNRCYNITVFTDRQTYLGIKARSLKKPGR